MTGNPERTLVNNFLKDRRENDFRALYRIHTPALYRLAYRMTNGDSQAAEDITQETWLRGIRSLPEFLWQSSLKTWLTGILINCFREHYRKSSLSATTLEDLENSIRTEPLKKIESQMDMLRALSVLPPGYREILVLHDMEGYKHEEIGTLLGISEGTSKSQLFHARNAMKKLLT